MINVLGRPSPRSASAGTTSCTNDTSSTRWNSSFRSTGNWDRSIDARRTIPGKRLPGRIRRSSSRPSGDRSEYPQFEHRSMLLWEYVVEFPTLRARGRRSTRHHQRATETLRRMRRLSGTPLRATSRRSGRRNPTASEARSTPEQRRGRAPSRRSLLPVPARRRAQRIPLERVSEPGRSTHQPRSGDSLSRVGETWSSVTAPATQGAASSCRIAARRFVAPPDGYEQQSGGGREVGYHLPASPHVDERGGNSRLQPRPYWALRRVRSDALHRVGGCFGVDVASDLRSLRFATDPPPLQVLPSHRDATAAERDDQRPHDHG